MKIFLKLFVTLFFSTIFFSIFFLTTTGYETDRFNKLLNQQTYKIDPNLDLDIEKIRIKLDIKKFNLFLSTTSLNLNYYNINVPIKNLQIYLDFFSIFKGKPEIKNLSASLGDIDIESLKKFAIRIKPSNFKSFILKNIKNGTIKNNIDVTFGNNLKILDYNINGSISDVDIKLNKKFQIKKTSFKFIADKNLVILNSISANYNNIPIQKGAIEVDRQNGINIKGFLNAKFDVNENDLKILIPFLKNNQLFKNKLNIISNLSSDFKISLSDSLQIQNYECDIKLETKNTEINLRSPFETKLTKTKFSNIKLEKTILKINLNDSKKNRFSIEGLYNLNTSLNKFKIQSNFNKSQRKYLIDFDFDKEIDIKLLNYKKKDGVKSNFVAEFITKNNDFDFNKIIYTEGKSFLKLNGLKIKNKKFYDIKKTHIVTFKNSVKNNDFEIFIKNKIYIKGKIYDSKNLIDQLSSSKKDSEIFNNISKNIEVSFDNILTKIGKKLINFNLIGKIDKGKFVKISSKSEFDEKNYLDISLKIDKKTNKKIFEIYSDLSSPILSNFSFFKGVEKGKLIFVSIFDDNLSQSNLTLQNFKVKNAPNFAKLLALADLGGVADLMSGEGISFERLEIKFTNNEDTLKVEEIYAVGPSISILMDGYKDNNSGLISLRGTMVPAKQLNKLISKIPVVGNILIPKEIGEGLFGVSFKMKGPAGKIKTSLNPIKTLTPRFITKALERRKKNN